jgi:hypothetical protein
MSTVESAKPPRRGKKLKRFIFISLALIFTGLLIYYFVCGITYSEGTRSGILVKISRKGYVFKTYEGELNLGGFNQGEGTILPSTIFKFSVANRKKYEQLEEMQGHKIIVHYREVIHNFFWQGETDYFVEEASYYK